MRHLRISAVRKPQGFTLIELMLVVSIIALLSAVAIPNFLGFAYRAKGSERYTAMNAIAQAVFERVQRTGTLPNADATGASTISADVNPAIAAGVNLSVLRPFDMTLANLSDWKYIDYRPDSWVRYSYGVTGAIAADGTGLISITATGDINGNGTAVTYTRVYTLGANGLWTPQDEQQNPPGEL
jgi:prepilin-type N-terminal cleavage/methylation domain-containing protein